jgi:hypothetical protein
MKVPVTVTYAPDYKDVHQIEREHQAEVRGMVNAVFEFMIEHGTPYDPDTIESGDYGESLEPYRESLTEFIMAWHKLVFAYNDGTDGLGPDDQPERKISRWKLGLLRVLFKPARLSVKKKSARTTAGG